jgi:uncharacterized protein (DUF58 family)
VRPRGPASVVRRVTSWWWRRARAIQPTRDGWWCVVASIGLGVAAVNTGNNLAYLLCSMLLALILVSGFLSDLTMRGLRVTVTLPDAIHAGQPALVLVTLRNRKRRLASYSVVLEALDRPRPGAGPGRRRWLEAWLGAIGVRDRRRVGTPRSLGYVARLAPGEERLIPWELTFPARGRRPLPRLRVTTAFPFGLFVKTGPLLLTEEDVVVFPAVSPALGRRLADVGVGEAQARRRGRGHDLRNLRPYRPGDEPHLIHWRTTARSGSLTVRELEEDTTEDTRIVLTGVGAADPDRLERALSEAASLAVHLLRGGSAVELAGAAGLVPLGRGRAQERAVLRALALYAPGRPAAAPGAPSGAGGMRALREVRVSLDPPA